MFIEIEKYPHGFWERIPSSANALLTDFQSHRVDRLVSGIFEVRDLRRESLIHRTNATSPFRCIVRSPLRIANLQFQEDDIIGR